MFHELGPQCTKFSSGWASLSRNSPPVAGVWWAHWRRCPVAAVASSKWMLHTGGGWGEPPHMTVKLFGCTTILNKMLYKWIIHSFNRCCFDDDYLVWWWHLLIFLCWLDRTLLTSSILDAHTHTGIWKRQCRCWDKHQRHWLALVKISYLLVDWGVSGKHSHVSRTH